MKKIDTLPLNHVRYIGPTIMAIDVINQEYANTGKKQSVELYALSYTNEVTVTVEYNNPIELFRIGMFANALMSQSPF